MPTLRLTCHSRDSEYEFERVQLRFEQGTFESVFADKNNKTVAETLEHKRYRSLSEDAVNNYPNSLDWRLGKFVMHLKSNGDLFYRRFLNKYGDLIYSRFLIVDDQYLNKKGLYTFTVKDEIRYIGRCRDSFRKRINQGYGKIHPKNCFLDGQATNCHLNALITDCKDEVILWVHSMESDEAIDRTEKQLIEFFDPPWNISLRGR